MSIAVIIQAAIGSKVIHRVVSGFDSEDQAQVWLRTAKQQGHAVAHRGGREYERGSANAIYAEVIDLADANKAYGLSDKDWKAALKADAERRTELERRQQEKVEKLKAEREARARERAIEAKAEELRKERVLTEIRQAYLDAEKLIDGELATTK